MFLKLLLICRYIFAKITKKFYPQMFKIVVFFKTIISLSLVVAFVAF